MDLGERSDCVGHNHGVGVAHKVLRAAMRGGRKRGGGREGGLTRANQHHNSRRAVQRRRGEHPRSPPSPQAPPPTPPRPTRSASRNPRSSTSSALMSYSFATHTAAVLRTYGSSSRRQRCSGSQRYSVILSTRMQPMVRTANARMSGLGSCESCSSGREAGQGKRGGGGGQGAVAAAGRTANPTAHACAHARHTHTRAHLDKGVDRHDREVGLGLGVVDEVEVHQLFELHVLGLHAVDDVCARRGGRSGPREATQQAGRQVAQQARSPGNSELTSLPTVMAARSRGRQGSLPGKAAICLLSHGPP